MKKLTYIALILLSLMAVKPLMAAETVYLYSYHYHPPFVTAPETGLTYKLADYLNKASSGQYRFVVKMLPRARLNAVLENWINGKCLEIECATNWVVAWVNPKWGFVKGKEDPYAWQRLFDDSNSIISLASAPVDYQTAKSLDGKTLLGMRGHFYVDIDARVKQGKINRIDGNHERDNLMKLVAKRGDAALLPTSTINYYLSLDKELTRSVDLFHISPNRHQSYTRFLMMPESNTSLIHLIKSVNLDSWITSEINSR